MARHSEYNETLDGLVYKLCLLGIDDEHVADCLNISLRTLNNWKKKHPTFMQAIKEGKDLADAEIAHSLYNKAKGFTQEIEEALIVSDGAKVGSHIEIKRINKYYAPDTLAQIFWLKNRHPEQFRDKREIGLSPKIATIPVIELVEVIDNTVYDDDDEPEPDDVNGNDTEDDTD